jgi:uncharacterized Tic20 family protein
MSLSHELEKLREMHINGDITDDEFAKGKAKLLAEDSGSSGMAPFAEEIDSVALEKQTREWALLLHLSMLAGYAVPLAGLVAPIVIWQVKKDELPEIDRHGKNAVNWIISHIIYIIVCIPLCFVLIGIPLIIAVAVMAIVFPIMAAIKGNNGEVWRYPLSITFLK